MKYKSKSVILALASAIVITFTACAGSTADSGSFATSAVGSTVGEPNSADFVSSAKESSTAVSAAESSNNTGSADPRTDIGLEAAKVAALNHAGIAEADASFTEAKREFDDGRVEYDIEFTANAKRYEYEISAADGTVLEFSSKEIPDPTGLISEERAKKLALAHAGFSEDQVTFTKCKLDYDDGVTKYEVKFTANGVEYEIEVNAKTEEILKSEIDRD